MSTKESLVLMLLSKYGTLHLAHEGVDKVRKAIINLLMSKLNRFVILDVEGPQEMFDRLMTMVERLEAMVVMS